MWLDDAARNVPAVLVVGTPIPSGVPLGFATVWVTPDLLLTLQTRTHTSPLVGAVSHTLAVPNTPAAIGFPLSVILPIIGLLSVTSEYSQRTGLTTYTLVPWRGRVITAKMLVTLAIGVASMFLALAVGAVGNLIGSAITGLDPVWNVTVQEFAQIVLANVLGMLIGFTLGVLMRSSAAAIVGYFVYSLVLPAALGALAAFQEWFRDLQPWVDVNYATTRLFDSSMTTEYWQQLGVTTLVWLWIPLAIGLRAVLRAEVK